jgi:CheY-like chemotaxis protein
MATQRLQGVKILLAEDDPDLRECIAESLSLQGADVVSAENGAKALELFAREPVDIVLSDYRMPGGDGLTFLRAVRANNPGHPPFVFLSGYSDISTADALKEGAQCFLHKPCDFREIAEHLLSVLKKTREQ